MDAAQATSLAFDHDERLSLAGPLLQTRTHPNTGVLAAEHTLTDRMTMIASTITQENSASNDDRRNSITDDNQTRRNGDGGGTASSSPPQRTKRSRPITVSAQQKKVLHQTRVNMAGHIKYSHSTACTVDLQETVHTATNTTTTTTTIFIFIVRRSSVGETPQRTSRQ